ncbi:MAG: hypothetical protein EA394_01580 [Bacteroidia bacterium]|nr:MAG: hypothetical protein EA394_01580 [Bacteroidia bacterium]
MKKKQCILLLFFFLGWSIPVSGIPEDTGDELSGFQGFYSRDGGMLRASYLSDLPDRMVFLKIGQGFSFGRLLDQHMSNLHYSGPGGVLSFSRYVESRRGISEIVFARGGIHYARPAHEGTLVYNPFFGMSYQQLRRVNTRSVFVFHLGGRADVLTNIRMAPSLSNSFLFADLIAEIQPMGQVTYQPYFLNRDWHFDFSLSFALLGYGVRLPEYATSFMLATDGGSAYADLEYRILHPANFSHLSSGIYIKESFGGQYNPNWFRIGYYWDYYRISGNHDRNFFNANHQVVLELYFMVN